MSQSTALIEKMLIKLQLILAKLLLMALKMARHIMKANGSQADRATRSFSVAALRLWLVGSIMVKFMNCNGSVLVAVGSHVVLKSLKVNGISADWAQSTVDSVECGSLCLG
jgi:hypothetical protein